MKEFRRKIEVRLFSFLAWSLIQLIGHTVRFQVKGYDNVLKLVDSGKGFILTVWHGRTMMPVYYCRHMGIWAITSLSKDGEIQTRTVGRLGYKTIRGSTGRGAIKAALAACKKLQDGGILAITPDGPKGPLHEVQEGIVFLAQRTGCPIIPIGVGARPRKLMNAWDEYALPLPFARCALIFGEPFHLADTQENQAHAETIKSILNNIQQEAQLMTGEGC